MGKNNFYSTTKEKRFSEIKGIGIRQVSVDPKDLSKQYIPPQILDFELVIEAALCEVINITIDFEELII